MNTNTTPATNQSPQPKKDKKWLMWGLIGFTVILLTTAVILFFQLKQPTPTATPQPKASPKTVEVKEGTTEGVCELSFNIAASPSPSPSPNASASPSPSPNASPSPSPSPGLITCFDTCEDDDECDSGLRCMTVSSQKRCVNVSCTEDTDCNCASPSPSTSPRTSASPGASFIPRASASPAPSALPQAGANTPLVLGVSAGILMMLLGLLF